MLKNLFGLASVICLLTGCGQAAEDGMDPSVPSESLEVQSGTQEASEEPHPEDNFLAEVPKDWEQAVIDLRNHLEERASDAYPLDFAASPNVDPEHSETVRAGVEKALSVLGPEIDSERPLAVTVVHPTDEDWFFQRWAQLGRDNTGRFWWDMTVDGGGGAVGWSDDLVPNMYFMVSDEYPPPKGPVDYYFHEVLHFLQVLSYGDINTQIGMCWIPEGTAMFVGTSFYFYDSQPTSTSDLDASLKNYERLRERTINSLSGHYGKLETPLQDSLEEDILRFPPLDEGCQFEEPRLGYTLGMLVAERFVVDFGPENLFEFFLQLEALSISAAFKATTGQDYEDWVASSVVPFIADAIEPRA